MRVLSLFSGIGMHDLGLQRAGMTIAGQCEIEPYCSAVLEKHWPGLPRWEDVKHVKRESVLRRCGRINLVSGGPPCQPSSTAGRKLGAADPRWLWGEWVRVVREIEPDWLVFENPPGFLDHPDSEPVFRQLEGEGYEVWTLVLGARHAGAPQQRDRAWMVANSYRVRQPSPVHAGELRATGSEVPATPTFGTVLPAWPPGPGAVDQIPVVADGLPRGLAGFTRKHALTAIGNANPPHIPELIGRWILAQEGHQ